MVVNPADTFVSSLTVILVSVSVVAMDEESKTSGWYERMKAEMQCEMMQHFGLEIPVATRVRLPWLFEHETGHQDIRYQCVRLWNDGHLIQ